MSQKRDAKCKLCRRNGLKLFLKGERCHTAKCAIEKRNYPPGGAPRRFGSKPSEYGVRLSEKQKLRFFYGVSEDRLSRYFTRANRSKGVTGYALLLFLERRLDNVIFRCNLSASRREAKQLVSHGHFKVNGKVVDISSYQIKDGDKITVTNETIKILKQNLEACKEKELPSWIGFDDKGKVFQCLKSPERQEIDAPIDEQLIVEYYSR